MQNTIKINTKNELFKVADDLYGLFFEDINRAADGGIYPEMIRNRSFEDSLIPGGCSIDKTGKIYLNEANWPGAFNHGEGMDDWKEKVPHTDIPGWYSKNAKMQLEKKDVLNSKRECSLKVDFEKNGSIFNIGYAGVPVKKEDGYKFYMFLKSNKDVNIKVSLESKIGVLYGEDTKTIIKNDDFIKKDFYIVASETDYDGVINISADQECEVTIGFTSLMPEKTYKNHGLRIDLVNILKGLSPKFLRFPGGCVVEGLTKETAMRFSNTIGEVWERPSHNLMWHYRTTNGLGFHEYLQLCEDLDMEAMYVCNCGISCQARRGKEFDIETTKEFLEEALNAIEYAIGKSDSKYGKMRALAGHEEPFKLKYLEIGNENWGEEYTKRYEMFYKEIKNKYPEIILISNAHTEKDGLPTECVDEHYYSTPEFFMENENKFDDYDRKGPDIFLGEYAVNGGNTIASMECALAEAAFLTGVERNQDIVTLSAYAPLLENMDYAAWKPNLIVFNNHEVYGIPTYHVLSLFAKYKGEKVVETKLETLKNPPKYKGVPGIMCEKPGLIIKNAKINRKTESISRTIYGEFDIENEQYILKKGGDMHPFTGKSKEWNEAFETFIRGNNTHRKSDERDFMWVTFGDVDYEEYEFEADLKFESDNVVTISSWNFHPETDAGCNEPKDLGWNLGSVRNQIWKIENNKGVTDVKGFFDFNKPDPEKTDLNIDYTKFNNYKVIANNFGFECYINGQLVQKKVHQLHSIINSVTTTTKDEIITKLVNVTDKEIDVLIELDCDIQSDIKVEIIQGNLDEVNSMESKNNISAKSIIFDKGEKSFVYPVKQYSINVLNMLKR